MGKKALNVEINEDLYNRLKTMKHKSGSETWAEFFRKVVGGEMDVRVEILSIDEEPANQHTAVFKLGEWTYRWDKKDFKLLSRPTVFTRMSMKYGQQDPPKEGE